jgi:acetyltransferase
VAETKPVVVVKSGRTAAGSRAAASHTGALATTEVLAEALFKQAGIIRVETLEELFDVANLLNHQPIPSGRRLAIITNGGGPGIMTADACAARGIELPVLSEKTISELRTFLPSRANVTNPIDMTAEATAEQYRKALRLMALDDGIDIVIVIFIPPIVTQAEAAASAIREVAQQFRQRGKPLLASFMGSRGASVDLGSREEGYVPSFTFPEDTASALAAACEYGEWLRRPKGTIPKLAGIDKKRAEQIVNAALKQEHAPRFWLDAASVNELLGCYGIRVAESKTTRTAEETMKAAKAMGFPVAVKLVSKTIIHKTDVGGVVLDVRSGEEAREAFLQIKERLTNISKEAEMDGVLVQKMVTEGVETIVGVTQDPSFGPLIIFGMGGIYTELFKDAVFRIHPLTEVDAREMVRSIKAYQLLEGWRGAKPSDIKAIEELLLRVSAMVEDFPQIMEMDLNPVKALERGYAVVDARILLS